MKRSTRPTTPAAPLPAALGLIDHEKAVRLLVAYDSTNAQALALRDRLVDARNESRALVAHIQAGVSRIHGNDCFGPNDYVRMLALPGKERTERYFDWQSAQRVLALQAEVAALNAQLATLAKTQAAAGPWIHGVRRLHQSAQMGVTL